MTTHDGGPVYPTTRKEKIGVAKFIPGGPEGPYYGDVQYPGMSLRDYFAASALVGRVAPIEMDRVNEVAMKYYAMADAMLAERERRGK